MKVYRIRNDVNRYQYFLPEHEEDWRKFEQDCRPKAEFWDPPRVYVYKPKLKPGDFYQFSPMGLVTSPRATEVLRTQLEMAGELLPLPFEGQEFTLLNVLECINCLDQETTEWHYFPDGTRGRIKRHAFHPERFSESVIFKIPETSKVDTLVVEGLHDHEEEFRYAVEQAGLKGLILEELWSYEE